MALWDDLGCGRPRTNALQRGLAAVVASRVGARVAAHALPVLDSAVGAVSGHRTTATEALSALPTITLTTTGARTGAPRPAHLLAIPHRGEVAIIGSNFGGARTPGWVHNLRADPAARVAHGQLELPVRAWPLEGDEAEEVWVTARRMYVGYARYRERAAHRSISTWLLVAAPTR